MYNENSIVVKVVTDVKKFLYAIKSDLEQCALWNFCISFELIKSVHFKKTVT